MAADIDAKPSVPTSALIWCLPLKVQKICRDFFNFVFLENDVSVASCFAILGQKRQMFEWNDVKLNALQTCCLRFCSFFDIDRQILRFCCFSKIIAYKIQNFQVIKKRNSYMYQGTHKQNISKFRSNIFMLAAQWQKKTGKCHATY